MELKKPQEYWEMAREYIIHQSKYLEENEPKYYLDKELAYNCIKFGSLIKHSSGELAGKNFQFMDFQIKAIVDILATKHKSGKLKGLRRYQRVLFFMPKKNGKTEFASLLNIIIFFLDKEKSKEIYSIASELEQAKILHKSFITMIRQDEELSNMVHITKQPPKVSKEDGAFTDEYEALSSTADSKDGKRPSTVFVDEGHAHKSKDLYQIMVDGMSGRQEPLEIHLSTAGYDMQNYFYRDIYSYAKKVKLGIINDETFYQVMFELDEEDMQDPDFWKNPKMWAKANPNYPISPTESYMLGKVAQAEQSEQTLISFKTKHLCCWMDKADVWIRNDVWTSNQTPINEDDFIGKVCYGGLDLATVNDLASLVLIFPDDSGDSRRYDVIARHWIPKDRLNERVIRDRVPYHDWLKKGLISATDGNVIDYTYIENEIKELATKFNIKSIAYDRHNSSDIVRRLTEEEVVEMIPFAQTAPMFNPTIKEIEILAYQGKLNHGNNEIMNWQCANVVLYKDGNGNTKIDKAKSIEKVDGMVSLAMAVGIAMLDRAEQDNNVYEQRGMRSL